MAKRQVALLGKMLLYSIDHLTEEEHQVYDSLVEELASRADSKKEISIRAGVPSPTPEPAPKAGVDLRAAAPPERPDYSNIQQNKKLQGLKPESVVRLFVECWDKQDFKQEFFCLSDSFKQGNRSRQTVEDYVTHRYEKYAQRHLTGPLSKQVVEISAPVVDGDVAMVQVAERHTGKTEDMILYRSYSMVFENTAWRILDFKTNQKRVRKRV
ncbi:MAG: hypothetical protein HUU16_03245 [Candidatus Omnitrophica bacterium]|nr:hypothetical protein [Candidatus Omnitrophota bacterium]